MKTTYRGHTIEVARERSLAGYPLLYYSIFREADGYECLSSYEDSAEKVRDMVSHLKRRVDGELACDDPWDERARNE